jgi:hypothetical protein
MKLRPKVCGVQPDWVCDPCGVRWGSWWVTGEYVGPKPHVATFHEGLCDVCGSTNSVTEARDYGYLVVGWDKKVK